MLIGYNMLLCIIIPITSNIFAEISLYTLTNLYEGYLMLKVFITASCTPFGLWYMGKKIMKMFYLIYFSAEFTVFIMILSFGQFFIDI